jgi:CDP-diacylglycerol--glycerol-3-phosphate 3-phosphatidyltransferase
MSKVELDVGPRLETQRGGAFVGTEAEQRLDRDDVAPARLTACDSLELTELLEWIDAHVRVRADADPDRALAQTLDWNEAVAEVRFSRRARTDARTGLGDEIEFGPIGVRGVDDRRLRAEATGAREQLDRADAVLGEALVDLALLLVGVHVQRQAFALGVPTELLQPVGRTGTHGVWRDADPDSRVAEPFEVTQVVGDGFLPEARDPAAGICDIEQHERDAGFSSRLSGRLRFGKPEIVKLADYGVTGATHLAVHACVRAPHRFRRLQLGLAQHQLAPLPEVRAFGGAAKRALERVRVRVDEAGELHGNSYPLNMAQLPNALTVLRLALIPVFVVLVLDSDSGYSWSAAIVFAAAGITDQIDGWLARRWRVESRFGKIADPLADRLMIDAAVILLWLENRLPLLALAVILGRDILLVGGYKLVVPRGYDFEVNFLGKTATWVLYASLALTMVTRDGTDWPLWLFWGGVALALVAAVQYLAKARREVRA